jgi:uncharacterized membrane protein YhaH (DUF805 family)
MLDSYIATFKKYIEFSGRATRTEFWTFVLGNFVIGIIISILSGIISSIDSLAILGVAISSLFTLATFLPSISVLVRRLHDTGRSGWWYWIALVPFVGIIILLVFLVSGSNEGENKYGLHPNKIQS